DQSVGDHADLEVWDLVSTQRVLYLPNAVTERAFCFHPSLPQVATCARDGEIIIRDLQDRGKIRELSLHADVPYWLCFSTDGNQIAVSYERAGSNFVSIIDTTLRAPALTVKCQAPAIGLAWQPHGRWLAVPDFSGAVRLIDTKTGETKTLGQHKAQA